MEKGGKKRSKDGRGGTTLLTMEGERATAHIVVGTFPVGRGQQFCWCDRTADRACSLASYVDGDRNTQHPKQANRALGAWRCLSLSGMHSLVGRLRALGHKTGELAAANQKRIDSQK